MNAYDVFDVGKVRLQRVSSRRNLEMRELLKGKEVWQIADEAMHGGA